MRSMSSIENTSGATANRDLGEFMDVSAPGLQNGTPVKENYMNDIYYAFRAVMKRANITPDNSEEGILTSQFSDAIVENIRSLQTGIDANTTFSAFWNDRDIYFSATADRTADITAGAARQGTVISIYNSGAFNVAITYYSTNTFTLANNEYAKFKWNGARWILIESNNQEFIDWNECFYSMSRTAEIDATNHIYEFTVTGDKTAYFHEGQKIKLTQTTVKYGIITYVETSGGNTILTVYGGIDYAFTSDAVSNIKIAKVQKPIGNIWTEGKWSIILATTEYIRASSTAGTYYEAGTANRFYGERGNWKYNVNVSLGSTNTTANAVLFHISASNSSLSVPTFLGRATRSASSSSFNSINTFFIEKRYVVRTQLYRILQSQAGGQMYMDNETIGTIITPASL